MEKKSVVIVGGGPAGLAVANKLFENGIKDIIILEREHKLGGILRQCIHEGFGLSHFGENLSGPEYAQRFIDKVKEFHIPYITNCTVLNITEDKKVYAASPEGLHEYEAEAVVLAMGCRERTRGALSIPGTRPSGVYTAGVAQAYMNLYNKLPGKEIVILGSGDIGMIMARRMTLEGAHVQAVFEIQPYASGLPRNIEQCLNDYNIPLYLNSTVTDIKGKDRLESVVIAKVDEQFQPIKGTEKEYTCDTLILSVGLIPENELSKKAGVILDNANKGAIVDEHFQTNVEGIFSAGNVLHVHDLVDFVTLEAENLACGVTEYIKNGNLKECNIQVKGDSRVGGLIPQKVSGTKDVIVSMRVRKPVQNCYLEVRQQEHIVHKKKIIQAIPAEMMQIKLKAEDMVKNRDLEICIVEEAGKEMKKEA